MPITHRLAQAMVRVLDESTCVRSLSDWSGPAIAAPSTLRMWCGAIDLQSRDVLSFNVALWVICTATKLNVAPADLLPFAERRTRNKFLAKSGPLGHRLSVVSVPDFCAQQTFLKHPYLVAEVARLVAERR